jgi:hypothetical protein
MQAQDARNIQLSVLLSPVEGVHQNEMSKLGKLVDDYPNAVKLAAGEGQAHNEIHTDVFPFPGRNTQRLQQSIRPHMISLDPSTWCCIPQHSEQSHASYGSTRIAPSNHDISLCCPGWMEYLEVWA